MASYALLGPKFGTRWPIQSSYPVSSYALTAMKVDVDLHIVAKLHRDIALDEQATVPLGPRIETGIGDMLWRDGIPPQHSFFHWWDAT